MPRIPGTIAATLLAALGAAHAHGEVLCLEGTHHSTDFRLRPHDLIIATADLTLSCARTLRIEGRIVAAPSCSIHLVATELIIDDGRVYAGDGLSTHAIDGDGGKGGDVVLNAQRITMSDTVIRAGRGGNAGPSGNGGAGGDIRIIGTPENSIDATVILDTGAAGEGGDGISGFSEAARAGGNGGDAGNLIVNVAWWSTGERPAPPPVRSPVKNAQRAVGASRMGCVAVD
ncbi:MAG: hypothetical protein U0625_06810 [Phycisphaerales bacterium]